ncbi:phosphatidylinositol-glycan biosynthesis class F protein [Diachasma alloeum]|uniref:phosphatidylinositol-glycan biosynthesis class F protein n=1 Tax=Diachasma alloeum TaxID=454923 RepID=UPI0007381862|nr:phosphatidylinositol-glycan biosynthesis class F protein [Diachasma alloeum]XP_015119356.1 phosphatidylinositol-glycan biosynthesis class F protein [Diachasma alloeum]
MLTERVPGHRQLLFYSSFTCIYFPCILILLKLNENLYNVGKYKFIPILLILMFAEGIKWAFSVLSRDQNHFGKLETRFPRSRKPWARGMREIVKFLTLLLMLCSIYYVLIILFGAPLSTHREETSMLAITLTTLTFVTPSLHLGVDPTLGILSRLQFSSSNNVIAEAMSLNIKATLLGTWLGVIVIPLDWDRPWQVWPIPCVIGALVGYMTAHFITLVKMLPIGGVLRLKKKIHR